MTPGVSSRKLANYNLFRDNIPSPPIELAIFIAQEESSNTIPVKKLLENFSLENLPIAAYLNKLKIEELLKDLNNIQLNNLASNYTKQQQKNIIKALNIKRELTFSTDTLIQFKNIRELFITDVGIESSTEQECNDIIFDELHPEADINPTNINGETPLMLAAACGLQTLISSLLARESIQINKIDKFGRTALYRAVENGHTNIVELLLKRSEIEIDIKCMDLTKLAEEGNTPLDLAILNNSIDIVKMFLTHIKFDKKTINNVNSQGQTLLWWACENNKCEIVKLLLAFEGIEVNKASHDGTSPYSRAALHEYTDIMQLFLTNPDTVINTRVGIKQIPILTWIKNGERWNIMERLIQHPKFHTLELEETDQISFFNRIFKKIATPEKDKNRTIAKRIFDWAVEKDSQKLICAFFRNKDFKLNKDFKVNEDYYIKGVHPLIWAFKNNQIEDALYLLERFKEDIEVSVINQIPLLQWAFDNMNMKIINSLLSRKNINTNDITISHTFFMKWTQKVCKKEIENKEIKKDLIFFQFLLNHVDEKARALVSGGWHILNVSIRYNSNEVTKVLLNWKYIELDFQDPEGKTPLYWAFFHGNKKIINLLLILLDANDIKIKKITDVEGNSLLHWAVAYRDIEIINLILCNKNIELRAQNRAKLTPYLLALEYARNANVNEVKARFLEIAALINVKVKAQIAEENLKHAKNTDQDVKEKIGEAALKHFAQPQNFDQQVRSSGGSGGVSISMDVVYSSTLSQSADVSMNYLSHSSYVSGGLSSRNPRSMSNFYEFSWKEFRDAFSKDK